MTIFTQTFGGTPMYIEHYATYINFSNMELVPVFLLVVKLPIQKNLRLKIQQHAMHKHDLFLSNFL